MYKRNSRAKSNAILISNEENPMPSEIEIFPNENAPMIIIEQKAQTQNNQSVGPSNSVKFTEISQGGTPTLLPHSQGTDG